MNEIIPLSISIGGGLAGGTLLLIAAYALRSLLITRLGLAIKNEYDEKLEALKSELKNNQEEFKADLQKKETELSALRSGSLSGITNRQQVVFQRKLEAVEKVWSGVHIMRKSKEVFRVLHFITYEKEGKQKTKTDKFQYILDEVTKIEEKNEDRFPDLLKYTEKEQPFVSEILWAHLKAYQYTIVLTTTQLLNELSGSSNPTRINMISNVLIESLPEYKDQIIEKKGEIFYALLPALEKSILKEIKSILNGEEDDVLAINQASNILKSVDALNAKSSFSEITNEVVSTARDNAIKTTEAPIKV